MIEVNQLCGQLYLGKQGENLARIVYFDEHATWVKEFGEGKCELLHQRNGDSAPYPVKLEMEDDRCCWKITASDTAVVGDGKCELHFLIDDVIVKSKIWTTTVLESLSGDIVEAPEPQKAWVDDVLNAAVRAEDAAERAEEAAENSGTGGGGTGGESIYITDIEESTEDSGINTITFSDGKSVEIRNGSKGSDGEKGEQGIQGIQGETGAKGDKGDKGEKGDVGANGADGKDGVSATHSWNGTVLTVTSASGTSSANLKGEKGDKGENSESALELWQPNTAYEVGDSVIAITPGDMYYILTCNTSHTSSGGVYYENDSDYWTQLKLYFALTANNATNDAYGNNIFHYYATKEELKNLIGDIETALDNIIAIQESLISGDSTTENGGAMEWA